MICWKLAFCCFSTLSGGLKVLIYFPPIASFSWLQRWLVVCALINNNRNTDLIICPPSSILQIESPPTPNGIFFPSSNSVMFSESFLSPGQVASTEHDEVMRPGLCPQDVHGLTRRQTDIGTLALSRLCLVLQCRGHWRGRKNFYCMV